MAEPFELPLPPDFDLDDNFQIRVTAIDPVTGDLVAGVNVGTVTLMVENLAGGDLASGSFGPFMFVPGPGA